MADLLTQQKEEIDKRLDELRPLHEEYLKLERAKVALDELDGKRRGPGRPPGSTTGTRRRRRRRGGTRAEQAVELVRQNPGISVADLADQLGIRQKNYLYRVMSNLQNEGVVEKQGRGYYVLTGEQ
jgi:predicted HTH transcriptional regulator